MSLTRLDPLRVLLGALVLHWCSQVAAEEPAAEETAAARLFDEGRALLVGGRFAEACPKLEESQRLEPRLGTQLNLAFCHDRLGKLATAWSGFQEVVTRASREGDVAREQFASARALALAPRVPWLGVRVAEGGSGEPPTILLDGAPLAASALEKEQPMDPGAHVLVAAHGGEEYWRTTLVLRESEHATVTIPAAPTTAPLGAPGAEQEPEAGTASRFVYEVGAFVGFIAVDTRISTAEDPASIRAAVRDENGATRLVTCASIVCDYPSIGSSAGFVVGVAGFVGYTLTRPVVDLGLRFLLGPRPGGGALVAVGPSASIPLSERFRVGPTVFLGTASHVGTGIVQVSTPSGFDSVYARMHGSLGFSWGLGAELGMTIFGNPSGFLALQATPLYFFGGNGSAWSLPLGAAYHWN